MYQWPSHHCRDGSAQAGFPSRISGIGWPRAVLGFNMKPTGQLQETNDGGETPLSEGSGARQELGAHKEAAPWREVGSEERRGERHGMRVFHRSHPHPR
jgi:hypothetical protein